MGGPGIGHKHRAQAWKSSSDDRFRAAGVGVVPDALVASRIGITTNAVSQYRHRRGIRRAVCEARVKVIREPQPQFRKLWHKGTGSWMIRLEPGTREITMTRFFLECRLGRRLHKDEIARGGKVTRGVQTGFHLMWKGS
jgi:hypothetical protein